MSQALIEQIKNRNRSGSKSPWFPLLLGSSIGYFIGHLTGAIIGIVIALLLSAVFHAFRGLGIWKKCENDYQYLISSGVPQEAALLAISLSFNRGLGESFHKKVIEKFKTLDLVVTFHTGSLPPKTDDLAWATKCLENTTIEGTPSSGYRVNTKW